MSAIEAEAMNVTTIRGFLQDLLGEAVEIDRVLHDSIYRLRERIYALELAEDESFVASEHAFETDLAAGRVHDQGLTADEFAKRYIS